MILYRIAPSDPLPARLAKLKPLREVISGQTWLAPAGVPFPVELPAATEWRQGLDGIAYAVIGEAPPLLRWRRDVLPARVVTCHLDGQAVPVAPAAIGGQPTDARVDLLGRRTTGDPATGYGALALQVADRVARWLALPEDSPDREAAAVLPHDPDVLALAVLALQSCHRLSEEAIHELGLLTTETIPVLCRAANGDDSAGKA